MLKTLPFDVPLKPPSHKMAYFSHLLLTECESLPAMALSLLPLLGLAVVLFPGAIFWAILLENSRECLRLLVVTPETDSNLPFKSGRPISVNNGCDVFRWPISFREGYDVTV